MLYICKIVYLDIKIFKYINCILQKQLTYINLYEMSNFGIRTMKKKKLIL